MRGRWILGAPLALSLAGCGSHFAKLPELPASGTLIAYRPKQGTQDLAFFAKSLPAEDFVFRAEGSSSAEPIQLLIYPESIQELDIDLDEAGQLRVEDAGLPLPAAPTIFRLNGETFEPASEATPGLREARVRPQPCPSVERARTVVATIPREEVIDLAIPFGGGALVGTTTVGGISGGRAWIVDATGARPVPLRSPSYGRWIGGPGRAGSAIVLGPSDMTYRLSAAGTVAPLRDIRTLTRQAGEVLLAVAESEAGLLAFLDDQGQVTEVKADGTLRDLGRLPDNVSTCQFSATTNDAAIFDFSPGGDLLALYHSGRFDVRADNGLWTSMPLPDTDVCAASHTRETSTGELVVSYGLANSTRARIVERTSTGWAPLFESSDLAPAQIGRVGDRIFLANTAGVVSELRIRRTTLERSARLCEVASLGTSLSAFFDTYGSAVAVYRGPDGNLTVEILTSKG
ncbi:MAG: hypothetical protein U1E65_27265 [Myxococcota bacterium]